LGDVGVGDEDDGRAEHGPAVDAFAIHVLGGDVRHAVRIGTTIHERGNVGMIQRGEDAALALEATQAVLAPLRLRDALERDRLTRILQRTLGQPHHAHAATPQLTDQGVVGQIPLVCWRIGGAIQNRHRMRGGAQLPA